MGRRREVLTATGIICVSAGVSLLIILGVVKLVFGGPFLTCEGQAGVVEYRVEWDGWAGRESLSLPAVDGALMLDMDDLNLEFRSTRDKQILRIQACNGLGVCSEPSVAKVRFYGDKRCVMYRLTGKQDDFLFENDTDEVDE